MSDPNTRPVLARIVAAHLGAGPGQAEVAPGLQKGLTRAIRRAALPFAMLAPEVAEVSVSGDVSLGEGVAALPEHGLLAAIEDDEGRRGLIALDHPLVDALIEVQATGRVEETDLAPRKITRIDEALCRDFLDLMLGAFAQETAEQAGRDWPDRMSYGSKVAERAQLNLLLPERGYRLLKVSVTMGGRKTGDLVVLLPVDQAIARRRAQAAPQSTDAPVDWSTQMLGVLGAAPMILDAVLMRVTMPLGEVQSLTDGDLVPFDHSDLSAVTLEDESGHVFARGGLGQLSGRRAVRFGSNGSAAKAPAPPAGLPEGAPNMTALADPSVDQPGPAPMGGLDPMAPMGAQPLAELPMATGVDMPMAAFDPDAPMGDFDPSAPMGDFDPNAPMGGFDPDAPMA